MKSLLAALLPALCLAQTYTVSTVATLPTATAVASDSSGNVYIVSGGIRDVTAGGISTFALPAGTLQDGLNESAQALATDASGNLVVGGSLGTLAVVSPAGKVTKPAKFGAAIRGLAVDGAGDIFVANSVTGVSKVTPGGAVSSVYPNDFSGKLAKAVATDSAGNLYVADTVLNQILKVDTSGKTTVVAGVGGSGTYSGDGGQATKAGLKTPAGVAADASGNIFIADSGNNRVRRVDASGVITTIAGNGTTAISAECTNSAGTAFDGPGGIALGPSGQIYVTDAAHGAVRVLTPTVPPSGAPTIKPAGVVPVYSTSTAIQPGSWVSIFGANLAGATVVWNGDFPTCLGGTSVTINSKPAYLWYAGAGQINLQAPDDTATGAVPVVVTTPAGAVSSTVTLASVSPSFSLLDGKHVTGIILRTDGSGAYGGGAYDIIGPTGSSLGYATVAARAGDVVELFGVGFGPTNPAVPAGHVYSGAAATTNPVNVIINGLTFVPAFAGLSGAGLDQVNFVVPAGLGTGDLPLQATMAGAQTQPGVVISLQ